MSKDKKKKKEKDVSFSELINIETGKSKKSLHKKYNKILKEIEASQLKLMEVDKLNKKDSRRRINQKEQAFYSDMKSIKARKKMAKKWEKNGFFERLEGALNDIGPLVRVIAKMVMILIITFLSIEAVQKTIPTETLDRLTTVFQLAMAV